MESNDKRSQTRLSATTIKQSGGSEDQAADGKPNEFALGAVLASRYRILELLGQGGMGAVYRARDLTLDSDVALKLLSSPLAADAARIEHFRNEVRLARKVTHANVSRLYDIACENGTWFITMELINGESLADRLKRRDSESKPLNTAEVGRIFRAVAQGLAAAHAVGVVHRDLKPDNVMLCEDGRAVVADFGIAVEVNQLVGETVDRAGTRGYMSPEQASGGRIDARTDVFALGVLGHRLLTGEIPAIAPTRHGETSDEMPRLSPMTEAPAHLAAVIRRCLERDPERRPENATAVLGLLAEESSNAAASRRRWPLALGAAAVAVASAMWFRGAANTPLVFAAPRVVVSSVEASGLAPRLRWYESAFSRRLANELDDAWGISARTATDPGPRARISDVALSIVLGRSDSGQLVANVASAHHGVRGAFSIASDSFQQLAEEVAESVAYRSVEADMRRPLETELTNVGINEPRAWRMWRRAQRAAIRQEWPKSRELAERAIELDTDCLPCLVELAWSYRASDSARLAPLRRASEIASRSQLGPTWRRIVAFVDADLAADTPRMMALIGQILSVPTSHRDQSYFSYRAFAKQWFGGDLEGAVPKLEWHVERFPRLAGVAKLLSEHYLILDGEEEGKQALRFAELAVAAGPDDLAARSQLARALVRAGERDKAREQIEIIESAGPEEKKYAVAGGERTNSLFDLYMSIGDMRGAAQAARRLQTGSLQQKGAADESLAYLAYLRGNESEGRRLHARAIKAFDELALSEFVDSANRRLTWLRFASGDCQQLIDQSPRSPTKRSADRLFVDALCRHRRAKPAQRTTHLDEAERVASSLASEPHQAAFFRLALAIERSEWTRALAYADLVRAGREWIGGYAYLGIAAEKLGDLEQAARWYERLAEHRFAWRLPIQASQSRLNAARLRGILGEETKAAAHYAAYIAQLDQAPPGHIGVETAQRQLSTLR